MSLIPNNAVLRSLVQQNMLQREFQDGLLPRFLFRAEVASVESWPGQAGDTKVFTDDGFLPIDIAPLPVTTDPTPQTYPVEQWSASLYDWKGTVDVNMVQSFQAMQSLYLRNAKKLSIQGGFTLNNIVRQRLMNAAQAGWTVADGAQGPTTTLRVRRINGFTDVRRPDLASGSPVRYETVSSTNPLQITVQGNGTRNVTGFTPDNAGDIWGPGTLTLDLAVTVTDRAAVIASNSTWLWRVGTGYDPNAGKIDQITAANLLRWSDIRAVVAHFQSGLAPVEEHEDGYYHMHIDPMGSKQLFADPETQRLYTARELNSGPYLKGTFSTGMGVVLIENALMPDPSTVLNGQVAQLPAGKKFYSTADSLGFELWPTGTPATSQPVRRALLVGRGFLKEYQQEQLNYVSDAGVTGIIADPDGLVQNNGVAIRMQGVNLYIRSGMNRTMDQISMTWRFIGDWVAKPDGCVGDASKYKRASVIEYAYGS